MGSNFNGVLLFINLIVVTQKPPDKIGGGFFKQHPFKKNNAGGGTRTHTPLRITDFESVSSANSDTPAFQRLFYHNLSYDASIFSFFCIFCSFYDFTEPQMFSLSAARYGFLLFNFYGPALPFLCQELFICFIFRLWNFYDRFLMNTLKRILSYLFQRFTLNANIL